MAVIIRKMDLPPNCKECDLSNCLEDLTGDPRLYCDLLGQVDEFPDKRDSDCPLEEQSDEIILHNDKVIIEPSVYLKPQALHDNVELILKQMESGDVTVLPPGFTAKIVRRDVVLKGTKGETDDN